VLRLFPAGSRFSGQLSRLYRLFAARSVELAGNVTTSDADEPFAAAWGPSSCRRARP
jgi:hypothetical protein